MTSEMHLLSSNALSQNRQFATVELLKHDLPIAKDVWYVVLYRLSALRHQFSALRDLEAPITTDDSCRKLGVINGKHK
jgi:hypothetical protein